MEYSSYGSIDTAKNSGSLHYCCFLCCSGIGIPFKSESVNESSFYQLSFRNISRYLQLLKIPNGNGEPYDLMERLENILLGFCEQCSQLAMEFNELYHLFEVTKLRLDWCVRNMQDVMTKAENEPRTGTAELNEKNEILRKELMGQLKQITPLPRVVLCKPEVSQSYPHEKSIPSPVYHSEVKDLNVKFDENECIDIDIHSHSASQTLEPTTEVQIKREIDMDTEEIRSGTHHLPKPNAREKSAKNLKCSFCRAEFKNPLASAAEESLHRHVAHYHCNQLFPNHKLESVTDSEFQRICGLHLFMDLINENEDTLCAYCNKRFTNSKNNRRKIRYISRIKGHLIQAHYENLEEKLRVFQCKPDLRKILSECDSIGEVCKCGVYLQNHSSRVTHDRWHCLLTAKDKQQMIRPYRKVAESFMSNFVPVSGSKLMCKLCKETLTTRAHATRHWKYYCAKGEQLPTPNGDKLSCDYCNYQCPNRMHCGKSLMKIHLVSLHPEHYFLSELEMDTVSKWKREHFRSIVVQILFPKFNSGDGIRVVSCSVCGFEYRNGGRCNRNLVNLKRHLLNNHKHELRECLKVILNDSDETLKNMLNKSSGNNSKGINKSSKNANKMNHENTASPDSPDEIMDMDADVDDESNVIDEYVLKSEIDPVIVHCRYNE